MFSGIDRQLFSKKSKDQDPLEIKLSLGKELKWEKNVDRVYILKKIISNMGGEWWVSKLSGKEFGLKNLFTYDSWYVTHQEYKKLTFVDGF